jgi:hypothetical protein
MKKAFNFWKFIIYLVGVFVILFLLSNQKQKDEDQRLAQAVGNGALQSVYLPNIYSIFPSKNIFGVEMNPITNGQGLEQMVDAGIKWVRRNGVRWSDVEPIQGGGYQWDALTNLDQDILSARNNGLEVIMVVRSLPTWATVPPLNYACGPISTEDIPAFGNFMNALVNRYGGAPYFVKYWEIWNEPDVDPGLVANGDIGFGCMGNSAETAYYGGKEFVPLLQAASINAKAANSQAQILVGGLLLDCNPNDPPQNDPNNTCLPSKFLEGILVAGGQNFFDGISYHAYDYFSKGASNYPTGIYGNSGWNSGGSGNTLYGDLKPVLVKKAQYIRNLLATYGVTGKYLINTETALICGAPTAPPGGLNCESDPSSDFEKLKAAYVTQSYAAAKAEGLVANLWYSPRGWRNSGLLNSDLSARPAYDAYVLAKDTLQLATFSREINEFSANKIFGYEFKIYQRNIWVVWAVDGKSHSITLPGTPIAVWDEVGIPVVVNGGVLSIEGLKTVYVDWGQ